MMWAGLLTASAGGAAAADQAPAPAEYRQDFSRAEVGKLPEGLMLIEGSFTIREEDGNRFLELPGAPLESFGVMFGSSGQVDWGAQARFFGTGKGRRFPVFGVSVNSIGGYRLQVAPAKKALELMKGDVVKATVPFEWASGTWTVLRIEVAKAGEKAWVVRGKAWQDGGPEPADWLIRWEETEMPIAGRAAIWSMPFSGTPIRCDDLRIYRVGT